MKINHKTSTWKDSSMKLLKNMLGICALMSGAQISAVTVKNNADRDITSMRIKCAGKAGVELNVSSGLGSSIRSSHNISGGSQPRNVNFPSGALNCKGYLIVNFGDTKNVSIWPNISLNQNDDIELGDEFSGSENILTINNGNRQESQYDLTLIENYSSGPVSGVSCGDRSLLAPALGNLGKGDFYVAQGGVCSGAITANEMTFPEIFGITLGAGNVITFLTYNEKLLPTIGGLNPDQLKDAYKRAAQAEADARRASEAAAMAARGGPVSGSFGNLTKLAFDQAVSQGTQAAQITGQAAQLAARKIEEAAIKVKEGTKDVVHKIDEGIKDVVADINKYGKIATEK